MQLKSLRSEFASIANSSGASPLGNSEFSPGSTESTGFSSDLKITLPILLSVPWLCMVQVKAARPMPDLYRANAGINQPFSQFTIEPTVFHSFIIAIGCDDILSPSRAIVAIP